MYNRINYLRQINICKTVITTTSSQGRLNPTEIEWTASAIVDFMISGDDLRIFHEVDPGTKTIEVTPQEYFSTKQAARDYALRTMFERYPSLLGIG